MKLRGRHPPVRAETGIATHHNLSQLYHNRFTTVPQLLRKGSITEDGYGEGAERPPDPY